MPDSARPGQIAQLPRARTSVIGREAEVAAVCTLLAREDVALVTLTGPGGVGKTRLAMAVADRLRDAFADGVWFVPLASLNDAQLVVPTIAGILAVTEQASVPLLDRLRSVIGARQLLLVLDNMEHVINAAPAIGQLLAGCPQLAVLATSRVPLRLYGERQYPVLPLALPDFAHLPPAEQLTQYAAVRLFVERATEVRPDFDVTSTNAPAVAEICRRLDGLPLAIELAAAWVKLLTPHAILERLGQRLPLLSSGPRDAATRQQTMRDTIAWSYALLDEDQQRLFRQLAVFAGGWTLEAAEAVCDQDLAVLDGSAALVDHSLIRQAAQPDDSTRFMTLETIRAYGEEQLERDATRHDVALRHAAAFVDVAEQASAGLWGPRAGQSTDLLAREIDNLRAAWSWIERHPDAAAPLGARLLRSQRHMFGFWLENGSIREGRQRIQSLLSAVAPPSDARAAALNALGFLATELYETDVALELHQEALELARAAHDRFGEAQALFGLGRALEWRDDFAAARTLYEQALVAGDGLGDNAVQWSTLANLSTVCFELGEIDRSMALEAEALQLARRAGDIHATAHVLTSLADHALRDRDDLATADALLRESLTLRQSLTGGRQSRFIAMTLEGLARHALGQGAPERCARLFGAADALRVAIGVPIAPFYQPISDQAMAGAQHLLGRERWERAWSEGHALSTDDAIAYALEEARPELDETAQAAPSTTAIAGLSPRELDVLRLLVDGRSNQEIAAALFISPRTTANHVANIMNKLGLDSRTAVATWAVRQGIE